MPYTQLYYHLIWATKYRTPFLEDDEIERFVHSQLRRKAEDLGARVFVVDG